MSRLRCLRRAWFRLLGAGPLVLLVAFLPSLLYVGHWGDYTDLALGRSSALEEAGDEEHAAHEAHCHVGLAVCADQPVTNLQVFPSVVDVEVPELSSSALDEVPITLQEHLLAPPTDPPRA